MIHLCFVKNRITFCDMVVFTLGMDTAAYRRRVPASTATSEDARNALDDFVGCLPFTFKCPGCKTENEVTEVFTNKVGTSLLFDTMLKIDVAALVVSGQRVCSLFATLLQRRLRCEAIQSSRDVDQSFTHIDS